MRKKIKVVVDIEMVVESKECDDDRIISVIREQMEWMRNVGSFFGTLDIDDPEKFDVDVVVSDED